MGEGGGAAVYSINMAATLFIYRNSAGMFPLRLLLLLRAVVVRKAQHTLAIPFRSKERLDPHSLPLMRFSLQRPRAPGARVFLTNDVPTLL